MNNIKNKKIFFGFTLIEMIGAIVVLSVIALIVYPTISRIIVNNKIKAYDRQIDVIKEAAANWLTTNEEKLKDNSYPLPIKDILDSGLIEEDKLINPIDNEPIDGCILITWRKGIKQYDYNYTNNCDDFVIPKLLALKTTTTENEYGWRNKDFYITLNGSDLENYYYCIDENKCEPNIMVNDINESILFNEEGIKFVCAYGMNKSGETEEICEKYKLDKTNPDIGTIVFTGTKGLNDWYVSDVTVTNTDSSDSLSGIDTNILSPSERLITKDTKGTTYKLTAKDKAGNVTEVSYSVKLDKTIPDIGELVINGTLGKNDWYTSDLTFSVVDGSDSISDHLTTTSSISSITTETSGTKVVLTTMNKAGLTSSKDYIFKMDKTKPIVGELVVSGTKGENDWYTSNLTFSVNNGSDNMSGHDSTKSSLSKLETETKGTIVTVTTENKAGLISTRDYNIKMDKTAPIIGELIASGTKGENDWYISDITFTVNNGSDDISGHASTAPNVSSITSDTAGTTVVLTTKNNAGLTSTKNYYFKMDKTAPTVGELVISGTKGENDWYTSNLTFSVNNGSDNVSGHKSTTSSLSKLETETTGTIVTVTTKNNAGLTSTRDYNIKMDKTAPTIGELVVSGTKGENDWYTSNITFSVNNGSDNISGHASTTSSISSITSDTDGTTVVLTTKNNAGLKSTKNYSFKVDKTKPTCTLAVATSGVSFKNKSSDVTSSGISTSTSANYSSQTASLSANTFYGYLKDRAGNTGKCSATVQATAPSYTKTTTTCKESSSASYKYTCSKSYDTCASGWSSCTWCSSSKCMKVTGNVSKTYTKTTKKCTRTVSGYEYNCKATNCPSYTTSTTCRNQSSCVWTNNTCRASSSSGTSNCSGNGGTVSGGICYIYDRTSACPSGFTQTSKDAVYSYSFGSSSSSTVSSCSTNTFTCNANNFTKEYTTCSANTPTCPSGGTYPTTGSYCYTYSDGSSYNGCSSGNDTGSGCALYNQSSCSSGWSSSVSSTTYTYSYSPTSSSSSGLSSCSASTGYSSCSGSYSSSQSSMKNKSNISCSVSGYKCKTSGYTKLNNSYCYKIG